MINMGNSWSNINNANTTRFNSPTHTEQTEIIMARYAKKPVNSNFYCAFKVDDPNSKTSHTKSIRVNYDGMEVIWRKKP